MTAPTDATAPSASDATAATLAPGAPTAAVEVSAGGMTTTPAIAIVIDDIGYQKVRLHRLLASGLPLNYAVIPGLPDSIGAAREIASFGKTILIHMPMEPQSYPKENPGPCALFLRMSFDERRRTLDGCAGSIPGAVAINNHMGSRYTEDASAMTQVVDWIDAHGLLFLDSRTTPRSVAGTIWSQRHGYRLDRTVFLDNDRKTDLILDQIRLTIKDAKRHGTAIAIGHPYPQTISAIADAQEAGLFGDVELMTIPAMAARLQHAAQSVAQQRRP